ncbi:MAG TPA: signal peptide peptidase SppA [Anaeromyxobacter sp.]
MNPSDPNEPLPTTPVAPGRPQTTPQAQGGQPPAGPPPGWGGWGWGWGAPPPFPPPAPPKRDRLAMGIVLFIFGGLFLAFFGFLVLAYSVVRGESPRISSGPRVGVLVVKGGIGLGDGGVEGDALLRQIRKFEQDDDMKAVVVRIDSPGGAVGPSQEIHDEVVKLAKKKTVVCSLGNLAASGGFYIAVACPKIVSAPGTLTGSIGVISQFPNVKGLAERFNFKMETVKSGKLKDAGNPFRDMTPEDRAYWQSLIDRVYGQFLAAVVQGRGLEEAEVRKIADGRVITGAEAKDLGLVDALGNFYDAVDLAKKEAKLSGEPHLVYPPDERGRFLEQLMGDAAGAVADAVSARLAHEARAAQAPGVYFLAQ